MVVCRTEHRLSGDLVFPVGEREGVLLDSGNFRITIRNADADEEGHIPGFYATVVGPAEDIRAAVNKHREMLASTLDALALVTRSRFQILTTTRAIEWEPGMVDRRMLITYRRDGKYPPIPGLEAVWLNTARHFAEREQPPYLPRALKYYRLGLLEYSAEDQFVKLWHALEILAENTRGNARIAVSCHSCKSALICDECKTASTRTPYPKDAIKDVMKSIGVANLDTVFKRQVGARNTLMHGGSAERILQEHKLPLDAIVNELGSITQRAILREINTGSEVELSLVDGNDLSNLFLTAHAEILFQHNGPEPHPLDEQIPDAKLTVEYLLHGK